jgi:polyisoprenoid-binding protein YceI
MTAATATQPAHLSSSPLGEGTWHVNPKGSRLGFSARGVFGLRPARGQFGQFRGAVNVDAAGAATGEVVIDAASLTTGNATRDAHLRSADFFDTDNHPQVKVSLLGLETGRDGWLMLTGVLNIRGTSLRVQAPVEVTNVSEDAVTLITRPSVDRDAAGLGWSRLGFVQGKAHLAATFALVRID